MKKFSIFKSQLSKKSPQTTNSGFALITVLFVVIILLAVGTLFISMVSFTLKTTKNFKYSTKAFYLAESGIEKAIWELNQTGSSYTGETDTLLDGGKFTTLIEVHPSDPNKRLVTATGYYPDDVVFPAKRKIQLTLAANPVEVGGAFHYALQVGMGGLIMSNGSQITGNVYSNGSILPYQNQRGTITGSAWVALAGNKIENIDVTLDVYAHTVHYCNIGQDVYYSTEANLVGTTVGGTKYSSQPDPEEIDLPIQSGDEIIQKWESDATDGGTQGATTVAGGTTEYLGPRKIAGDLTVENNATLIVQGVIWVTGNITFGNGSTIRLDPDVFGEYSGVILADDPPNPGGKIIVENGSAVQGTGIGNSYLMLLTTNTGITTADFAIDAGNTSDSAILYATDGIVWIENTAHLKEVTAKKIWLKQNAIVTYEAGLADPEFMSGPGGIWIEEPETWDEIY